MSAVRMCDRCSQIFKEGAEGAEIVNGTKNVRDDRTGRIFPQTVTLDVGPCCAFSADESAAPRLAVTEAPHEDVKTNPQPVRTGYARVAGRDLVEGDLVGLTMNGEAITELAQLPNVKEWTVVTDPLLWTPELTFLVKIN